MVRLTQSRPAGQFGGTLSLQEPFFALGGGATATKGGKLYTWTCYNCCVYSGGTMSNSSLKRGLRLTFALMIVFSATSSVHAHGGPPRLELVAKQATAGASIDVWGINLGADLPISVTLVGGGSKYSLGIATCDGQGDFLQTFTLPGDLVPGLYTVRAITPAHVTVEDRLEIKSLDSLAMLMGWIASLPTPLTPLVFGMLAVLFAGLALSLWWRETRATRRSD
jgi:hypothetical protein